jgi:hypothetical protein
MYLTSYTTASYAPSKPLIVHLAKGSHEIQWFQKTGALCRLLTGSASLISTVASLAPWLQASDLSMGLGKTVWAFSVSIGARQIHRPKATVLMRSEWVNGSYQGTRQINGVGPGGSSSVFSPAFTNDRSPAVLGALFSGQRGLVQTQLGGVGPAIAADGSNISAPALALLNLKLPNGQYVIPTPQAVSLSVCTFRLIRSGNRRTNRYP